MRTSLQLQSYTMKAQKYYADGHKAKGDKIKRNKLPAFAPAGYLMGGKGRINLVGLTGICFVDIDHIEEETLEQCMSMLRENEHVLLASQSISGHGLHILVPYTIVREDLFSSLPPDPKSLNQIYNKVFWTIAGQYGQMLGVPIDKEASNAERLCLISYDADAWYNPCALPIECRYEDLIQ